MDYSKKDKLELENTRTRQLVTLEGQGLPYQVIQLSHLQVSTFALSEEADLNLQKWNKYLPCVFVPINFVGNNWSIGDQVDDCL